jgi:hypothetical protein
LQNPPAPHCVPQVPQFDGSVCVFAQRAVLPLPHSMTPVPVHDAWHPPPLHTEPEPQMVPHVPQLRGSLCVSTHAAPQADSAGSVGVQRHMLATQISGALQTVPHVPQFFESELVVVQRAPAPDPQSI